MLVALLFREIEPVKVLGYFPQLSRDCVIVRINAVDMRPTQRFRGGEPVRPCDEDRDLKKSWPHSPALGGAINRYRPRPRRT